MQTMPNIVYDREWVVEAGLREKTGLTERQITSYRQVHWAEGFHFKRIPQSAILTPGCKSEHGTLWYNYPRINQFVAEA